MPLAAALLLACAAWSWAAPADPADPAIGRGSAASKDLGAAPRKPATAAATAPAPKPRRAPPQLPGEPVEFPTRDGWTLSGKYLAAQPEQPTFILLHDARGRHNDWAPLARVFQRRGIGYLALDLRGHGLSQKPPPGAPGDWRSFKATKGENDWDNIREDAAAAAAFLAGRGVREGDVALGGADVGGSVALKYAAVHAEVAMVFLLSPGMAYREVLTVNAMRVYKNRPLLMVVAEDDRRSLAESAILHEFAKRSAGPENVLLLRVARRHGTKMLAANRGLSDKIADWVENPVQLTEDLGLSTGTLPSGATAPGAAEGRAAPGSALPSDDDLDRIMDGSAE